jgi:uncharacterized protein (TIGR02145 family)
MNKKILVAAFFSAFLSGCQSERVVDAPETEATTSVAARVQRGASVTDALYNSTDSVYVRLQAGSYDSAKTVVFSARGCTFSKVPVGVTFTMILRGFRERKLIWSGSASGTTQASGTKGGSTAADVVVESSGAKADSLLNSLSIDQGIGFKPGFASSTTSYVDSVDADVKTVDVLYKARTSADVDGVRCNDASCSSVALSSGDPTTIDVVVTNINGNTFSYELKVYHKASVPVGELDSTLVDLRVNGTRVPGFSGATTSYAMSLKLADHPKILVSAKAKDSAATVTCNSKVCTDSIPWSAGDTTTVTVKVARKSGGSLSYTVKVRKDTGTAEVEPQDVLLKSLKANGTLLQGFQEDGFLYVYTSPSSASTVAITAEARTSKDSLEFGCAYYSNELDAMVDHSCSDIPLYPGDTTFLYAGLMAKDSGVSVYVIKVYHPGTSTPANDYGIPWQTGITYGTVKDSRDGRVYKTVTIGGMVWMAENLAYSNSDLIGGCPSFSKDSCAKYGRLYSWAEAMGVSDDNNDVYVGFPEQEQGICPEGWHVSSDLEWAYLEDALGMDSVDISTIGWRGTTEGSKLKSSKGWSGSGGGTDAYGFRVLPAGNNGGVPGAFGAFWTSTDLFITPGYAGFRQFGYNENRLMADLGQKTSYISLRCVQDYPKGAARKH